MGETTIRLWKVVDLMVKDENNWLLVGSTGAPTGTFVGWTKFQLELTLEEDILANVN